MTKQEFTFNALDSYFLNTSNNTLNIGYLNDQIYMQLDIVWRNENAGNGKSRLHMALMNKRRTNKSIVWEAFMDFANTAIRDEYGARYQASSAQLKKYLEKYGKTLDALKPAIDEVDELRRDYVADKTRNETEEKSA